MNAISPASRAQRAAMILGGVRAGYGGLLVLAPGAVGRLGRRESIDERTRRVARILGARHLAQAAVSSRAGGYPVLALGAALDLLHASSMGVLGVLDRSHRRTATLDALIAASFAVAGLLAARRVDATATGPSRTRTPRPRSE